MKSVCELEVAQKGIFLCHTLMLSLIVQKIAFTL
jgi:hypothetical protein